MTTLDEPCYLDQDANVVTGLTKGQTVSSPPTPPIKGGGPISFWIITSWFIKWLHVPIEAFVYSALTATIALSFLLRHRLRRFEAGFSRKDQLVTGLLGLAILLKFLPFFFIKVPPGADMSMHTYLARLIVRSGGLRSSFEPLLPVSMSGAYALGFHYLTAMASTFSKIPVYLQEFRRLQLQILPRYVYIGAKLVYLPYLMTREELDEPPTPCEVVYQDDGVVIFRALDPKGSGIISGTGRISRGGSNAIGESWDTDLSQPRKQSHILSYSEPS